MRIELNWTAWPGFPIIWGRLVERYKMMCGSTLKLSSLACAQFVGICWITRTVYIACPCLSLCSACSVTTCSLGKHTHYAHHAREARNDFRNIISDTLLQCFLCVSSWGWTRNLKLKPNACTCVHKHTQIIYKGLTKPDNQKKNQKRAPSPIKMFRSANPGLFS